MSQRNFLARVAGGYKQLAAIISSAGAGDAFKIAATGSDGKFDMSLMPNGLGAATNIATASEGLAAGNFVNYHNNAGAFSCRLADNSNGRRADGFVAAAVTSGQPATVYPLDGINAHLTGLTIGSVYYLGTAGGVIASPLDEAAEVGTNKLSQRLGVAKSATEIITEDDPVVIL